MSGFCSIGRNAIGAAPATYSAQAAGYAAFFARQHAYAGRWQPGRYLYAHGQNTHDLPARAMLHVHHTACWHPARHVHIRLVLPEER